MNIFGIRSLILERREYESRLSSVYTVMQWYQNTFEEVGTSVSCCRGGSEAGGVVPMVP